MKAHNYMEDVVDIVLPKILQSDNYLNQCTCQQCINDMKAIALNNIKPRYVSTEKGSVLSKANMFSIQSETDVTQALIEAIKIVNKLPRHKELK